jgi:hypothetical protein
VWANTTTWLFNEADNVDEFTAKGLTATDCEMLDVGGNDGGIVSVVIGCVVVVVGAVVVVVVVGFTVVVVVVAVVVVVVAVGALVVVVVVGALVVVVVAAGLVVVVEGGGDVVVVTGLEAPAPYSATQSTCSDSDDPDVGHAQPAAHHVCC